MTMTRETESARHFGAYLKKRRTDKGLTQVEVADRLGTFGSTISLVENGKQALKEEQITDWAKAYQIGPSSLRTAYRDIANSYPEELVHSKDVGLAFNQMMVQCKNKGCTYYQQLRLISLPIVGSGLFVHSNIMCECGWMPTIEETPAT